MGAFRQRASGARSLHVLSPAFYAALFMLAAEDAVQGVGDHTQYPCR
jgi:hypothetical protein